MSSSKREAEPAPPAAFTRYLRTGVRSAQEALTYLRRRGVPPPRAAALVSDQQAYGLVDDRAAARLWAGHWARHGFAAAVVRQKLADKRFDAHTITDAMHARCPPADDAARARLVAARYARLRVYRSPSRLARVLALRGFDPDVIEHVLRESFGSDAEP